MWRSLSHWDSFDKCVAKSMIRVPTTKKKSWRHESSTAWNELSSRIAQHDVRIQSCVMAYNMLGFSPMSCMSFHSLVLRSEIEHL